MISVRTLSAHSVFLEHNARFQPQVSECEWCCECMMVPFKRPITIKVLTSLMVAQIEPSKEQQRPRRRRKKDRKRK